MNIHKLPYLWRGAGVKLAELAATYPRDHVTHACLLNRQGALDRCADELEEALQAMAIEESKAPRPELRRVIRGFIRFNREDIRVNFQDGTIVGVHLSPDGIPLVIERL